MNTLSSQINHVIFPTKGEKLLDNIQLVYKLIDCQVSSLKYKELLKQDFDFFKKSGRYLVKKTFTGGLIFLREPETIEVIKIEFHTETNEALASVEYSSEKRNSRNIKYKPNAGKIESLVWKMSWIFPHFDQYGKNIKIALMMVIGQMTKVNCEVYKRDSWFMNFDKEFEIQLFLDGELELNYGVYILDQEKNIN